MSRRRKPAAPQSWLDWTPEIRALFQLVPVLQADPIGRLRVSQGVFRRTLSGRVQGPDGRVWTVRLRLVREAPDAAWGIGEESVGLRLTLKGGGA